MMSSNGNIACVLVLLVGACIVGYGFPGVANASTTDSARVRHVADPYTGTVDLNRADIDELRTLPGIGPARARAIVEGRPYSAKQELVERNILPRNVYDGIARRLIVKPK